MLIKFNLNLLPWGTSRELRSPWTPWWSWWVGSWWPLPPAWWCWVDQTDPWWTPQTGNPSVASRSSPPSGSWWRRGFLSSRRASDDLCTPLQTHLREEKTHDWDFPDSAVSNVTHRFLLFRNQTLLTQQVTQQVVRKLELMIASK